MKTDIIKEKLGHAPVKRLQFFPTCCLTKKDRWSSKHNVLNIWVWKNTPYFGDSQLVKAFNGVVHPFNLKCNITGGTEFFRYECGCSKGIAELEQKTKLVQRVLDLQKQLKQAMKEAGM